MLSRQAGTFAAGRIEHTVQVTSFGGCGTSAVYAYLSDAGLDIPKTFGQFPFKHQRVPPDPTIVPPGFRVVYLYGDPRNAVLSIFRRGRQLSHYRGMRLANPSSEAQARLSSLESFVRAGIDYYELEDHFEQWWGRSSHSFPVLFVRYELLAHVWPTLRDFVGLPAGYPCLPLKSRSSDWRSLPPPTQTQLDRIYGRFARRVSSLPPVVTRGAPAV
jgi:hypothetical protein